MAVRAPHGPAEVIRQPNQIETAINMIDNLLAMHAKRSMIGNAEFTDALLDVRNVLDAYWGTWDDCPILELREKA